MGAVQAWLFVSDFNSPTFFGYDLTSQKYSDIARYHREAPVEVVVVGHSKALNGIDPAVLEEVTGRRTYNFGMAATDLHAQAICVRDFIVPRIRPQVLLWHVGLEGREQQTWAANQRILESPALELQSLPLGAHAVTVVKDLMPYQKRHVHQWIENLVTPRNERYDERGFMEVYWDYHHIRRGEEYSVPDSFRAHLRPWQVPLPRVLAGPAATDKITREELTYTLEEARADIESAFAAARAAGIRICAFSAPMYEEKYFPPGFYQQVRRGLQRDYIDWMSALFREYDVEYANYGYYASISGDDHLFYNPNHLNVHGARILSEVVAHHLIARDEPVPQELEGMLSLAQRHFMLDLERGGRRR